MEASLSAASIHISANPAYGQWDHMVAVPNGKVAGCCCRHSLGFQWNANEINALACTSVTCDHMLEQNDKYIVFPRAD